MKPAIFLSFLLLVPSAAPQEPAKPSAQPSAPGQAPAAEAFVIESQRTVVRFENDGTGTRETAATIHVLSEAGVKQLGLLTVGYSSASEDLTFPYVRVRKADGTVIPTPPDYVQDTTSEITREAPMFSDYHEKHVTVRGLAAGDRLEYDALVRIHHPLVPGQFWTSYTFGKAVTVLDEELEVNLPKDRYVNVKSTDVKPVVREENGRRIYLWKTSHHASASDRQTTDELPPPPVQISTFKSWDEVGRWWGALEEERAVPTPELRAKAADLTKDAKTDTEKVQAIYNYVALNFRYISISFGIGRVQPHAADDVFKNAYGDCKDKHTLMAALLKAVGIEVDSALINSTLKLDPDVPSPGQFDHVISLVPLPGGPVWLDTTTEIAPFRYLTFNLRDKQALVVRPGKPAELMTTPADPPFQNVERVEVSGKLGEDGTLEAKVHWIVRNDTEILLRATFRQVGQDKWKDVVQAISYVSGYGGDVSDVSVSPPEATGSPFEYSYQYTRKDYPDWANKRITAALPPFGLPQLSDKPEDSLEPVKLGQPGEVTLRASIELPKGYTPQLLPVVDVKRAFAEYHSEYHFKDGALVAERRLVTKMREVPASQRADYKSFWKAVTDEYNVYTELRNGSQPVLAAQPGNPKAVELLNQAREAFMRRDLGAATEDLEEAVKIDPSFEQGWFVLATLRLNSNETQEGMEAIRKAIALNPANIQPYKILASQLMGQRHEQEAIEVWRALLKQHPDDGDVHTNLGNLLLSQKQYQEAAVHFDAAVKAQPDKPFLRTQLGFAYLGLNDVDKAMAAFTESIKLKSDPLALNDIAYSLADKGVRLTEAQQWAEQAVAAKEAESATIATDAVSKSDLQCMGFLAGFWDTLGWVYFREGSLERAQRYLEAAWDLTQDSVEGEHLGEVYEKEGKKAAAAHQYALAKAVGSSGVQAPVPMLRRRDGSYAVSKSNLASRIPLEELSEMRRVKLGKLSARPGSAEFWVLFGAGSKVDQIKFISGDEKMRSLGSALHAAKFNAPLPDDHPAKLLRRGVLVCEGMNLGCDFTLFTPDMVNSTE